MASRKTRRKENALRRQPALPAAARSDPAIAQSWGEAAPGPALFCVPVFRQVCRAQMLDTAGKTL
jgi:hypothetical protein